MSERSSSHGTGRGPEQSTEHGTEHRTDPTSEDPAAQPEVTAQPSSTDDTPRLGPRPLHRPTVDAGQAARLGGPSGGPSASAPRPPIGPASNGAVRLAAPPPEALSTAFGRPADSPNVRLQRAPGSGLAEPTDEPAAYWDGTDGR